MPGNKAMAEEANRSRRRVRRIGKWGAILAVLVFVVAGLWYWLAPPYHQFTVFNGSGRDIEIKSVQIGDVLIKYYDNVVLETYSSQRKNIFSKDNIFLHKWIRKARIVVKFRFLDGYETEEFVSEVDTGWNFECHFVLAINADRLRTSGCQRPEIYDFR